MPGNARYGRFWLGGSALCVVALAIGWFGWFTPVGRAGTLIGDRSLAKNDFVFVDEFKNDAADSSLAQTVTDAIRLELEESGVVRVADQAAGAKAAVTGSVARDRGGYVITARIAATKAGHAAQVASATARDSSALIDAMQSVAHTLRREIGEPLRNVFNAPPLAVVASPSLPALRAYTASLRAEAGGRAPRAVELAKQALTFDTAFAAAWAGLYTDYGDMGLARLANDAAARAYARRGRLSAVEGLRIAAIFHEARTEYAEAEVAWSRLAAMGRNESDYTNLLLVEGRLSEAEAMGRRAVTAEPKNPAAYWNLAEAQAALLHFAAADSTAALVAQRLPDNGYRYYIPISVRWARRDLGAVQTYLQSADGAHLRNAFALQCLLIMYRGRIHLWQQCADRLGLARQFPLLAMAEFRVTGDSVRARAGYADFLSMKTADRDLDRYPGIITLLCDVGHVHEARQLLDEWRARVGAGDLAFRADSAQAVGAIAAAETRWDAAAAAFLAWNVAPSASSIHLYNRGLAEAATALARGGHPDRAIDLFERALGTSSLLGGNIYEAAWYGQSLAMLGDEYVETGSPAKAVVYYSRYLQMLDGADAPLAARAEAVRKKLSGLVGMQSRR